MTITQPQANIFLAARPLEEGLAVRAALLLGTQASLVIDTLTCPADMDAFHPLIAAHGKPLYVVNTHADWDHAWGNAAFPRTPIIGQELCRTRLLGAAE